MALPQWCRLLTELAARSRSKLRLVGGTHILVHQCAANAVGRASAQAMGRTRRGRNTKLMAATDASGLAVNLLLIEGQRYEGHCLFDLLPLPRGLKVIADKGFDSDKLRQQLEQAGA